MFLFTLTPTVVLQASIGLGLIMGLSVIGLVVTHYADKDEKDEKKQKK